MDVIMCNAGGIPSVFHTIDVSTILVGILCNYFVCHSIVFYSQPTDIKL